jgi:hypothetical protein
MKAGILAFFESLSKKFKYQNLTRLKGTLYEDQYTYLIVSRSGLLRVRNVSDKSFRENENTHFIFTNIFFSNILLL